LLLLGVLLVAPAVAFGQTGGTALPLATPANVWLNAGSGVTTSGSAVTTWVDQSGNTGRNATQATSTAQPTFVTSSATFAGQPVLQFDGGDWLSGTWRAASGAAQASMFAVHRLASSTGTQVPMMVGPGAASQGFGIGWNTSFFNSFLWGGADARINGFNSNTVIHAGTITGGTGSVWLNGQTATASGGSASLGNAYNVGRGGNGSFNLRDGSQLAEIVIFESALGAGDVTTMGNYLAAKYGVATTTSRLWSGGSSDATAASNWGGTLASGDQLVFQGATATSPTVGSTALSVAGIAFARQTADATATAAFTLDGTGTITLGANGIANWAAATQTITAPLSLSASSAWNAVGDIAVTGDIAGTGGLTKAGGGTLTLSGFNTHSGGTIVSGGTLLLANAAGLGAGAATIAGGVLDLGGQTIGNAVTVSGGILAGGTIAASQVTLNSGTVSAILGGTAGLAIAGTGTVTLSGQNTYSGSTTISAGRLALSGNGVLGSGSYAGAIANAGELVMGSDVAQILSGVLSGTGGLTKTGAGTLTLSGSNTYSGLTTISAGTLSVAAVSSLGSGSLSLGAGTLEVTGSTAFSTSRAVALTGSGSFAAANSAGMTLSGVLSGAGGFTKTGTGSLTISNANNTYTGPTIVNGGTLISAGADTGNCIRGAITINSGATLQLNVQNSIPDTSPITINGGTFAMQTFMDYMGNLTLGGGAVVSGAGLGNQSLITNGVVNSRIATTGTGLAGTISSRLALTSAFGTVTGNRTQNFEVGTGARLDVTGAIIDTQPGGGAFVGTLLKTGDGELRLSGANTYSGGTQITAGTLWFGGLNALGTGTVTLGNATLQAGTAGTVANAFSLTGSGTFDSQANANTLSGAIGGTGGLTKTGPGTLTLSASNTFSGGVTLSQGTIAFASGGLGSTGNVTLAASTVLQWAAGNTEDVSARLVLPGSGSVGLNVAGPDAVTLASGLGVGSGASLTKAGAGTLILSGANAYSGGTAVDAGVLVWLTPAAQPASGTATVANGAALSLGVGSGLFSVTDFETLHGTGSLPNVALGVTSLAGVDTTAGNVSIATPLGGTRGVAKTGPGTLTLSGSNTYSGLTLISAGTLSVAAASALGSGSLSLGAGTLEVTGSTAFTTNKAVAITGGGSFAAANSGGMTLSGVLSGAGGFTKTGTGSLTLSNAGNTYAGPTIVNEGTLIAAGANTNSCIRGAITINPGATLQLNVQNCIPDTSPITLNGGTFAMQTNMEYMGNLTLGGGAIVSGAGTGDQSLITNGVANSKIATTGTGLAGTISSRLALASQFGPVTGNRTQNFEVGTGARLDVTGAIMNTQPGSAAFVGTLLKTGAGELRLSGTNTYSGGTTLSAGTLRVTSPSGLGSGNVAVQAGGRLAVAAALVLGGTSAVSIADGGFLTVDGGGSLRLAASASLRGFESPSSAGGTTLAAIRSGVSNGGTLSVNWLTGPQNSFSDAIDLVTGTGTIAPFVLQLNFDAGLAGGVKDSLLLGWLNPATSQWVNAVAGNTAGSSTFFAGSWDAYLSANPGATATTALGAYGVDPVGNTVWAAVDHNSEFTVIAVPEPGTLSLAGLTLAAAGAAAARRRRRGR
jgi:autotransporter-associated beta strand protein